ILALTRFIGVLIIMVLVSWLLLATFRGKLHPIGGLGVALGICVLLFPVVQPWYLLWAFIPLAAWATRPGFRVAVIVITLVVGIFGPTANGDRFALFQILDATLASAAVVALLVTLTYTRLPWRPLQLRPPESPEADPPPVRTEAAVPVSPATPPPTAAPDAYADST
ncbi:MAG TPA: polyprenol phosphomannose-dependent alpha 1,6 mannosyltransferase MptB, partial [Mycobacterium sp.]